MIVVDLGCKSYEDERSIEPLIERFAPTLLYGFDPNPELEEGIGIAGTTWNPTVIVTRRLAAWTHGGVIPYAYDGTRSGFARDSGTYARCFDFPRWLDTLPSQVVVKVDIEGGEYHLLEHLEGRDRQISLLLVEWHGGGVDRTRALIESLVCPVEEWPS